MTASLFILLAAVAAAGPQPATRAEVAAQRTAIEQRFAKEKAECQERFTVSACVDEARERRREALAPLVAREHELAAEERKSRAAAQMQRVRERDLGASQDEAQRRERLVIAPPRAAASAPAAHAPRAVSPAEAARARQQADEKAEADAAQRREQAQERRQRVQQRIAEREAKEKTRTKPLAKPLPLPDAAAAPASAASR